MRRPHADIAAEALTACRRQRSKPVADLLYLFTGLAAFALFAGFAVLLKKA
jgi:hypothetical protein